jgi:hypothetical protein
MTTNTKTRRIGFAVDPIKLRADLIAAGLLKPGPPYPPRVDDGALPLPRYRTTAAQDAARYQRDEDER